MAVPITSREQAINGLALGAIAAIAMMASLLEKRGVLSGAEFADLLEHGATESEAHSDGQTEMSAVARAVARKIAAIVRNPPTGDSQEPLVQMVRL